MNSFDKKPCGIFHVAFLTVKGAIIVSDPKVLESMGFAEKPDETPLRWQCSRCRTIVIGPTEYNGVTGVKPWVPGDCPSCHGVTEWKVIAEKPADAAPERIWVSREYCAEPNNLKQLLGDDVQYVRDDITELKRAVIEAAMELRRTQSPIKRIADHELAWNKFKDAADALLKARENK